MTKNKLMKICLNLFASLISALGLFVQYKITMKACGQDEFGACILLISAAYGSRLFEFGIPTTIQTIIIKNSGKLILKKHIKISIIVLSLVSLSYGIIFVYLEKLHITHFLNNDLFNSIGYQLAFIFLAWMTLISSLFNAINDAMSMFKAKAIINTVVNLITVPLTYFLVENYSTLGFLWSLIFGLFITIFISYLCIERNTGLYVAPGSNRQIYLSLLEHWKTLQLSTFAIVTFDPFVKYLISNCYGYSGVSSYEISNQLLAKIKNYITISIQALGPSISGKNINEDGFKKYLKKLFIGSLLVSILVYGLAALFFREIFFYLSGTEFGEYDLFYPLVVGYGFLASSVLGYVFNVYNGFLKTNTIAHVIPLFCIFTYYILFNLKINTLMNIIMISYALFGIFLYYPMIKKTIYSN